MHFEFPFQPKVHVTGKSIMAFLTGQSWCIIKSWYTGEGPEQGYRCCFTNRLNQKFGNYCEEQLP